jgi:hypothetical protein
MMRARLDGAITTGIVRERETRIEVTSPASNDEEPASGGNVLSRAWRLIASPVARQKAAEGSPS